MCHKNKKRLAVRAVFGLFSCGIFLLSGCGKSQSVVQKKEEPIKIPIAFRIDPATNQSNNQEFAADFNEKEKGKYEIDVEWITESATGYREKLKQWNVLDQMPAVITDAGFGYDFYRLLVENNRLVDLRPYMEEDPEWSQVLGGGMMDECMEESGEIYLSPLGSAVQSYAGIIYNKELLAQAGYDTFPQTWDEFWACMDKLQEQGITPLSLHSMGSYWVPMLLATSYLYNTEEGEAFLQKDFPKSYQNQSVRDMLTMLQRLYQYSYEDADEIDYDEAAERFLNGEAAVFANGYWMILEMPEEVISKMAFATFPNHILMNSPRMSGWAVTAGYDQKTTEGAVEVLKYRIQCDLENTKKLVEKEDINELQRSYIDQVEGAEKIMPNYQMKWESQIQDTMFSEYIPQLLNEQMTVDEFIAEMDRVVESVQMEK